MGGPPSTFPSSSSFSSFVPSLKPYFHPYRLFLHRFGLQVSDRAQDVRRSPAGASRLQSTPMHSIDIRCLPPSTLHSLLSKKDTFHLHSHQPVLINFPKPATCSRRRYGRRGHLECRPRILHL